VTRGLVCRRKRISCWWERY